MHPEALRWVYDHAPAEPGDVLDIGGRNINGSARVAFKGASSYTVIDILAGDGVDIVADAATWEPEHTYDTIVCCEVFEHTPDWREICATAYKALEPGGLLIVTCAGPGRPAHSGVDGQFRLLPGEHYENVHDADLLMTLKALGFADVEVDHRDRPADTRAVARR